MNDIIMTIYASATGLYTNEECDNENLIDAPFPYELVKNWFYENEDDLREVGIQSDDPFETWLRDYSTADCTDSLLNYAYSKGYKLIRSFDMNGRVYTRENLEKIFKNNVDRGGTSFGEDDGVFMDWFLSLFDFGMKDRGLTYEYTPKKKYLVCVKYTYEITVEAQSEDEAKALAMMEKPEELYYRNRYAESAIKL